MKKINYSSTNTIIGIIVALFSFGIFTLTVEPTASYWDCAEYISTSAKLQVGHPPGAPLFQMLGAIFSTFAFESDKIDSEQKNHNILLSDKAKINSNPKLKISCDDVKCAHGSTIGNLDRDALFYLRSRGINLGSAKKILLDSFMHEIIDLIDNENIRNEVKNIIDKIL